METKIAVTENISHVVIRNYIYLLIVIKKGVLLKQHPLICKVLFNYATTAEPTKAFSIKYWAI